jgi:hypothetical protein
LAHTHVLGGSKHVPGVDEAGAELDLVCSASMERLSKPGALLRLSPIADLAAFAFASLVRHVVRHEGLKSGG